MTVRRTPLLVLLAAIVGMFASVLVAGPAKADLYRYWSVWQAPSGSWTFVETAPDSLIPTNGEVIGWRYAVGGVDASTMRPPRTLPTFAEVCGSQAPAAGEKQVVVVIDPGTAADAPEGETPATPLVTCATVPESASAVQTLQAVADTRVEGGLVCAVLGYPTAGCGDTVAGATEVPTDSAADLRETFATAAPAAVDSAAGGTAAVADPAQATQDTTSNPNGLLLLGGLAALLAVATVGFVKVRQNRELSAAESGTQPGTQSGTHTGEQSGGRSGEGN